MTKERVLELALKQLEIEILKEFQLIEKLDELEKLFAERMELRQEINSDEKESETEWFQFCSQKVQNIQKCLQECIQELREQPESESGKEVKA